MIIKGIDEIDNQLVNLLLQDGRMSYSDLAAAVGLSRTAVKTRVAALEKAGIIRGYKAVVDPLSAPTCGRGEGRYRPQRSQIEAAQCR